MIDESLPAAVAVALETAGVDGAIPATFAPLEVRAAGIPFWARVWGAPDGRPLLLIHGVTASSAGWWRLGPALAATGRRVVAMDLPGHGRTGHWAGHFRFRDNAADVAAFARGAGLARADLQVVGHSWGAMTAAALPAAGLRPSTIVLLDPPAVTHATIAAMAADPDARTYDDLSEAVAAVRRANPDWPEGDVSAKAQALTQLDEAAARSVLLDNGDWDGGLGDVADPSAAGVSVWVVRGDPAAGGLLPEEVLPEFAARIGTDHIFTIPGGAHSPQRLHPRETTAALLHALGD